MRLEYVCDMELAYREEPTYGGKFLVVQPVVQETMQPAHHSLWLRPPEHDGKQRYCLATQAGTTR